MKKKTNKLFQYDRGRVAKTTKPTTSHWRTQQTIYTTAATVTCLNKLIFAT